MLARLGERTVLQCKGRGVPCTLSGHAWMSKPRTGSGVSMGKKTQHKVELDCCHEEEAGPLFFAINTQALKQEENDECSDCALGTADGPGYC